MTNDLSKTEIITAASFSENPAVKKAFDKLRFALELAHTKEEIEELAQADIYQLRISHTLEDGNEYENIMIRWCGEDFVVYAPSQGGTIAGRGHTLDKDPAIVYLKKPLGLTKGIMKEIAEAKKACYGKLGGWK